MMTCGWETLRLPRLTDHIAPSSISNGVNVGVSPEKHRARRETCKDQVLWTETDGRHTRDSCTPLPPRRMALRNSAISSGDGASSPAPPLRDGASGPVQKLPACCVWLTVSHLAFYKLHQSAECNSSNFLHSSRAV